MLRLSELPHDVLEAILEQLTPREALQLSRTNKRLNSIAIFHVLHEVTLGEEVEPSDPHGLRDHRTRPRLSGWEQLVSFATFVLSNTALYAHHIRSLVLTLHIFGHSDSIAEVRSTSTLLVQVLPHVRELRRLHILHADHLRPMDEDIFDAIAALEKLDYLNIGNVGQKYECCVALLSRMRSRPSEIVLDGFAARALTLEPFRPHHNTLRRVTIGGAMMIDPNFVGGPCDTFPRVESVHIKDTIMYMPSVDLSTLFPKARHATLHNVHSRSAASDRRMRWASLDSLTVTGASPMIVTPVRNVTFLRYPVRQSLASMRSVVLSYAPATLDLVRYGDREGKPAWCASIRYLHLYDALPTDTFWESTLMPQLEDLASTPLRHTLEALCVSRRPQANATGQPAGQDLSESTPVLWAWLARMVMTEYFTQLEYVGFVDASQPEPVAYWYRRIHADTDMAGDAVLEKVPQSEVPDLTRMLENLQREEA
ncbi:hypothetical protein K466DRAFT_600354 [Polyporus arcularius HHB13444]|uniref:F-box domain-containing protein n=1 Tax=Polyporus arcularius HHB13444 TaxID=1314778 RepID=A0A5C3PBQ0_9APHY|nr:hypothetical protein K466DRAFT_600354 [Polyporus arcularius HHB13444]